MSINKLQTIIHEKVKHDPEAKKAFTEHLGTIPIDKLARYFNIKPMNEVNKKLNIANDLINESYSKLSPIEKEYVSLVESNNKLRVYRQIKITESLIKGLRSNKEKELAMESVAILKKDITDRPLIESAERALDLKYTIKTLLEGDEYHGGIITKKLGNLNFLKDIRLAIMHDEKDAPETLYITFETPFYPLGTDFSSVKASLTDLDQKFGRMGRNILNKTIHQKGRAGTVFTGEGIWDGGVRINSIKPGGLATGSGELTLHINVGSLKSIDDAKKALIPVLKDLDALIPVWFPETDKKAQKMHMKSPDKDDQERINALKATAKRQGGTQSDEFGGHF